MQCMLNPQRHPPAQRCVVASFGIGFRCSWNTVAAAKLGRANREQAGEVRGG
jgi:hypothetical protein